MLAALFMAGCATARREPSAQINDPYEAANRKALEFNQSVFGPVARGYHTAASAPIRQVIGNVSANLAEPRIFGNDLLQLRFDAGAKTVARFAINSTAGVGGLFDVASAANIPKQTGDFGQTMFVWGVEDGPYLVSPFFGPATSRDTVGLVVDEVGDPAGWALGAIFGNSAAIGVAGLEFVSQIDQLKQAQESSIDFYSFLRSSYYQTRRAQLREAAGLPPVVASPADIGPGASKPPAANK